MTKSYRYNLSADMGIDYQDSGPWRSYELYAYGDTLPEAIKNAFVSEIDQEGAELKTYELLIAPEKIYHRGLIMIEEEMIRRIKDE